MSIPISGLNAFVFGLPISCSSAAMRSHKLSVFRGNFIHHLQSMTEHILVMKILPLVHTRQLLHFRKNNLHDARVVHQLQAEGRPGACHDF